MVSSSSSIPLLVLVSVATLARSVVEAYPLIAQVAEASKRCFQFNTPEDDDAHMVLLALPMAEETGDTTEGKLEGWLVQEVYAMTNQRQGEKDLPRGLLNSPPADVQTLMDAYLKKRKGDNLSKLRVIVSTETTSVTSRMLPLKYFIPTVLNRVGHNHKQIQNTDVAGDDVPDLGAFGVCFDNEANEEEAIQVILDIVMVNAEPDEGNDNEPKFDKEKHLSPLEESLEKSIRAANTVLKEMKYMTDREERMRLTADSINQRVQYFSILSVAILLGVTYVQVTYLKRYFKKKKLM